MRLRALAIAFATVALACTSTSEVLLAPDVQQLVGRWQTVAENINVVGTGGTVLRTGSYRTTLVFGANGDVSVDTRQYGLYGAQRATDLSAYTTMSGTFRVVGDSLTLHLTRSVWWDAFYGANSPEHAEALPTRLPEPSRFRVEGNQLILDYLSYPADAPVPTTATYIRAN